MKDSRTPPGFFSKLRKKRYRNRYFVRRMSVIRRSEPGVRWEVWRANVGGDIFFVEEFFTKEKAEARADELNKEE